MAAVADENVNPHPQPPEDETYHISFVYPRPADNPYASCIYLVSASFNDDREPSGDIRYIACRRYNLETRSFNGDILAVPFRVRGHLIGNLMMGMFGLGGGQPIISYELTEQDRVEVIIRHNENTRILSCANGNPNSIKWVSATSLRRGRGMPGWMRDIHPNYYNRILSAAVRHGDWERAIREPIADIRVNKKRKREEGQGGGLLKTKKRKSKKRKSKKRKSKKRKSKKRKSKKRKSRKNKKMK